MTSEKQASNPLEAFVLLAKGAKGAAAVELIKQVTEAPGVYVFGELLDMPGITELSTGDHAQYFHLLQLFAFGTYSDYLEKKDSLPFLSPAMAKKLRHLTIVSLATKNKYIPYSQLLESLDLKNMRELEDLIIEVIYANIIRGKLDQKNQNLEIDHAIGRDIQEDAIKDIVIVLNEWCNGCETMLLGIDKEMAKANHSKESFIKQQESIDQEVENIKKTLSKSQSQQQDGDDSMVTESASSTTTDTKPVKKTSKSKGLRGSGKIFK